MTNIISYIRVSTQKQGKSGLGLEAQQAAIAEYVRSINGNIAETFIEIDSGSNNERVELAKAIASARKRKATLVVAKLDRLGRDAAYLLTLVQSCGCPIVLAECPTVDKMMFGILAVIAENERDAISKRTKAALAAAKARGVKLGANDPIRLAKARERKTDRALTRAQNLAPIIESIERAGIKSLAGIAEALQARGVKTPRGNTNWQPIQVSRIKAMAA